MGVLNTTPATWAAGEFATSTKMNLEVRDALTNLQSAWVSYAPTWAATGTAVGIGNGTFTGLYQQIGKTIIARFKIFSGTTTTYGTGNWTFALPVTPSAAYVTEEAMGVCSFRRSTRYSGTLVYAGGGVCLVAYSAGVSTGSTLGQAAPGSWASGDLICSGLYTYEAA